MRHWFLFIAMSSLAACSGGNVPVAAPVPVAPPAPVAAGTAIVPHFQIVVSSGKPAAVRRAPAFVSPAAGSVTITLSNPPSGPHVSLTSAIAGASCTAATPCAVNGPPSPTGVPDQFLVQTFASADGSGAVLDTGSTTATLVEGQSNTVAIVLLGVPATVALTNVPTTFAPGTGGQTQSLTATVYDAANQPIGGTFATPVIITSSDASGPQGTTLTGSSPVACATSCVRLSSSSDTVTLNYGGLAESPVTFTGSGSGVTGTATFTPLPAAIVHSAGPQSLYMNDVGIDLTTSNAMSTTGYSGVESYGEAGFTNAPYDKSLTLSGAAGCAAFATVTSAANATTGATDFSATAIAGPVAGICTLTVSDGLTHASANPTFVVTYTSSGFSTTSIGTHK